MSISLEEAVRNVRTAELHMGLAVCNGDADSLRTWMQEHERAVGQLKAIANNIATGKAVLEHLTDRLIV